MRISYLSKETGLPVATIKYYLRERLLPPGRPTGRNQADYDDRHLRRLQLIRALTHVGKLDLSTVRQLLASIEDRQLPLAGLYEVVHSLSGEAVNLSDATADVDQFIDELGWAVHPDAAGRAQLAQVVAALRRLGCDCSIQYFAPYAAMAEQLVEQEMALLPADDADVDRAAAVVRAVLLEVALTAVHRMAREHYVYQWLGKGSSERPARAEAAADRA
ncbi:MerR family transcriptional regulator [Micromonospora sp. NPDC050784]|uniref:MerR family transcriptional regulator n=1 Tax=Micromonospora sp. NPDC050784 TaxID=3364281 RepID=UPI00379F4B77